MKKVLSFVLILALVLGSFSFAFGLTDVTDADANSEAIRVSNDFGIITGYEDGSFQADKAVNRAEFAAMITRALAVPESALAGFSATNFKDTAGYGWAVPYLAFCESKGIMIGDGQGNVMPGRTINVNEAVTMVVRSIGYTEKSAVLVGTWPAKYVTVAQDLGLYDDVADMATVNRGSAAQVIYNALKVQKVQVDADGATTGLTDTLGAAVTMLTSGLGAIDDGYQLIDGDEASDINLRAYIGAWAQTYSKDGDIVAMGDVKTTFLTGEMKAGNELEVGDTTYTNVRLAELVPLVAEEFNNGVSTNAAPAALTVGNVYTLAVELSGKKVTDIYSVADWTVTSDGVVTATDLLDIEDGVLIGEDFDLDDDDNPVLDSFELVGASSLDDIAVDDVVYVYTDGTLITKVEVGNDVVSGVATKVSNNGKDVTVDGTVYAYAVDKIAGVAGAVATGTITAGDAVELTLDAHGFIYDFEKTDGAADDFAVVINTANDADLYGGTTAVVQMIIADGTIKDYNVDSDLAVNIAGLPAGTDSGAIVKYSLNKDGELDNIVPQTMVNQVVAKELTASGFYNGSAVKSDAVYFAIDIAAPMNTAVGNVAWQDKDDYGVATFENLKGSDIMANYVLDTNGKIAAMLLDDDATASGSIYGFVTDKYTATDADGDLAYYFSALIDGAGVDYEVSSGEYATINLAVDADMEKLYQFKFNSSGQADLTAVNVATGANAGAITTNGAPLANGGGAVVSISLSDNVVKLIDVNLTGDTLTAVAGDDAYVTLDPSVLVYVYNKTDQVYEKKSLNTLRTTFNGAAAGAGKELFFFVTDTDDFAVPNIAMIW